MNIDINPLEYGAFDDPTFSWTKTPPTEPGWYWFYHIWVVGPPAKPKIVHLEKYSDNWFLSMAGSSHGFELKSFPDAYWLGPLPVPDAPGEE